ncbi:MAG: nucleotidyltransferase domain-containing protein [Nanoarchaeota archaeon]
METKLNIFAPFFDDPHKDFTIRELSRMIKINHTTVRQYLVAFVKEGFLQKKNGHIYPVYSSVLSKKYLNLKLYYNLEKIRESKIVEYIEKKFDFPVIVLFGSYAKAQDRKDSDIDICVISNIVKELSFHSSQKILCKPVQWHLFSEKEFDNLKKKNPELVNNIANGIVLSGELKIL